MTEETKQEQREQIAAVLSCEIPFLHGVRFGELLSDCEREGATVYWGFWTEAELNETL